jgi:hypothetical protein
MVSNPSGATPGARVALGAPELTVIDIEVVGGDDATVVASLVVGLPGVGLPDVDADPPVDSLHAVPAATSNAAVTNAVREAVRQDISPR